MVFVEHAGILQLAIFLRVEGLPFSSNAAQHKLLYAHGCWDKRLTFDFVAGLKGAAIARRAPLPGIPDLV